jgi:hypothetical protein
LSVKLVLAAATVPAGTQPPLQALLPRSTS